MNLIGNNIRRLREERNMLQSELAAKVNVSPATVSSWEVGRTEPKIGKVEEICAAKPLFMRISRVEVTGFEPVNIYRLKPR